MPKLKLVGLGIVLCTIIGLILNSTAFLSLGHSAGAQDVRGLENRMTMLEQRLYSIQTSINRLEQTALSQRSTGTRETVRDHEINVLNQEILKLKLRVDEAQCGLLKLDERTRRGDRSTTDPCRLNPNSPLQLRERP
jgi:peptidoglycan hydrolase CwlO-like protein